MRVLITGAGGQVGREVAGVCEVAGDEVVACDHATLDVGDRDAVLGAIGSTGPDVVVHAAAWTAVDACEDDPQRAFLVNGLAVRYVADACRRFGAHLVHVSTDYVFSGNLARPYLEWDDPDPVSVYGRSKRAGEIEVGTEATVVRTAWVMGAHGHNMVKTILGLLDRPDVAFVDDQRGCPTFTADLAPMLRRLALDRRPGIHHVTNQGPVSWYEFARAVFDAAGADPGVVRPISTADLDPPRAAPRPANSVLENAAIRMGGLDLLPHYRESLDRVVKELRS